MSEDEKIFDKLLRRAFKPTITFKQARQTVLEEMAAQSIIISKVDPIEIDKAAIELMRRS